MRAVEDRTTRMGKGYAFITFKTADMVSKAMAMQDAVCFEGRELRMQEIIRKKKNVGLILNVLKHSNVSL